MSEENSPGKKEDSPSPQSCIMNESTRVIEGGIAAVALKEASQWSLTGPHDGSIFAVALPSTGTSGNQDENSLPLNLLYDIYGVGAADENQLGNVGLVTAGQTSGSPELSQSSVSFVNTISQLSGNSVQRRHPQKRLLNGASASSSQGHVPLSSSGSSPPRPDYSPQISHEGFHSDNPPTVFQAQERYRYVLDAPTSVVQKRGEDSLTYLNKGQFYSILLEGYLDESDPTDRVRSVVHLGFRDERDPGGELQRWQYWHSQQPNPNQKAFDVDRKSCQNVEMELIDDIAYNACSFIWNPRVPAKIVIRINCLSTEFSSQKGVKGIPLHLQVDTYEDLLNPDADACHKGFCQIKVFRDKGAERKNKDESKSAEKRMARLIKSRGSSAADPLSPKTVFNPPSKKTVLLSTTNMGPKPVYFTPVVTQPGQLFLDDVTCQSQAFLANIRDREQRRTLAATLAATKDQLDDLEFGPQNKKRMVTSTSKKRPIVTIYVRKEEEKVYNALMLDDLSVLELKSAVSRKYGVPAESIKNVYKKTKRGLLVNFDNQMVEQFSDEDDFSIKFDFDNQTGHVHLYILST